MTFNGLLFVKQNTVELKDQTSSDLFNHFNSGNVQFIETVQHAE